MPIQRLTRQMKQVLAVFVERPTTEHYGLDLCKRSGLPSGTLYQILTRLEQARLVERHWEAPEVHEAAGRPRRRYYRLTSDGAEWAAQVLTEDSSRGATVPSRRQLGPAGGLA